MAIDSLTELRGLHDPPMTLGMVSVDAVVALAIGLLISWIVVQMINLISVRRQSPARIALQRLTEIKSVEGDEGLTARALVLQQLANALPDAEGDWLDCVDGYLDGFFSRGAGKGMREALYHPEKALNLAVFDSDLKVLLERADR